jgi:hypothetical protein
LHAQAYQTFQQFSDLNDSRTSRPLSEARKPLAI